MALLCLVIIVGLGGCRLSTENGGLPNDPTSEQLTDVLGDGDGNFQEITFPEFPGVTFRYDSVHFFADDEDGTTEILFGMPIECVYFDDLNGDGKPEIISGVAFGSGIVDCHIIVYDYAAGEEYTLWDRGEYDYLLEEKDGEMTVKKYKYSFFASGGTAEPIAEGRLALVDGKLEMINEE